MLSLRSKITQKVLGYFLVHQGSQLYVNQMCQRFGVDRGNLVRKLKELEKEGVLKSHWRGNQRYYGQNPQFPLMKEYTRIFLKTVGLEHSLTEALRQLPGVQEAYLFGSYAENRMSPSSDLDLLVVGGHDTISLQRAIAKLQKKMDREINVISMSLSEYQARKRTDPFLRSILSNERISLI